MYIVIKPKTLAYTYWYVMDFVISLIKYTMNQLYWASLSGIHTILQIRINHWCVSIIKNLSNNFFFINQHTLKKRMTSLNSLRDKYIFSYVRIFLLFLCFVL